LRRGTGTENTATENITTAIAMDYDTYEAECEKIRTENQTLLDAFQESMEAKKLSKKTVNKHVYNIDFYINEFLLYEEPQQPEDGIRRLNYFFSYWFIRKAMWASATSIKENITSLKKFYGFMEEKGRIEPRNYIEMLEEIKESKEEWLEGLRKHDADIEAADPW
jgi:site-specific recombinase XerD